MALQKVKSKAYQLRIAETSAEILKKTILQKL